jgi:hypothetical protein
MSSSVPFYVSATNTVSSYLVGPLAAAGVGGFIGSFTIRPRFLILSMTIGEIFWQNIEPYTFRPIFMHASSTLASKCVGFVLSTASLAAIFQIVDGRLRSVDNGSNPKERSNFQKLATESREHPLNWLDLIGTTLLSTGFSYFLWPLVKTNLLKSGPA